MSNYIKSKLKMVPELPRLFKKNLWVTVSNMALRSGKTITELQTPAVICTFNRGSVL